MIKITANNIPLLLKEGTEITVKERNPLFESDISGTAYPVSIPAGENMAAMKLMHRPGAQSQKIDINLEYGSYYRRLLGVVNKASASGFELSAKLDDSIFMIENGDRDIRDAFPVSDITLQDIYDDPDEYRGLSYDFCVPEIQNHNFHGEQERPELFAKIQNDYTTTANFKIPTPFFFLEKLIKKIAENGGYSVITNFEDLIKRAFIYNNTSVFYYSQHPHWPQKITPFYHLPEMTVRDFINEFCMFFNLRMYPNHSQRTIRFIDFEKVAKTPAVSDWSDYLVSDITLSEEQKFNKVSLRHEIDSDDPASPWVPNQNYDLSFPSQLPNPNSGYQVGTLVLIEYSKKIFILDKVDEDVRQWKLYSLQYPEISVGNGNPWKKILTKFSSLAGSWNGDSDDPEFDFAHTEYEGNWSRNLEMKTIPCRLGVLDHYGNAKTSFEGKSLVTGDFTGSASKRYERTIAWYLQGRRLAEATFKIPAHILFNLDLAQKFYANGVTFYIEELNYRLTNNGIVYLPAKIRIF